MRRRLDVEGGGGGQWGMGRIDGPGDRAGKECRGVGAGGGGFVGNEAQIRTHYLNAEQRKSF